MVMKIRFYFISDYDEMGSSNEHSVIAFLN